jgi:hypothetical protein
VTTLRVVEASTEPEMIEDRWIRNQAIALAEFAAEEALRGQFGYGAFVVIMTDDDRGYAGQFRIGLEPEEQKRVSLMAVSGLRKLADELEARSLEINATK